jgi:hypothetical protein
LSPNPQAKQGQASCRPSIMFFSLPIALDLASTEQYPPLTPNPFQVVKFGVQKYGKEEDRLKAVHIEVWNSALHAACVFFNEALTSYLSLTPPPSLPDHPRRQRPLPRAAEASPAQSRPPRCLRCCR